MILMKQKNLLEQFQEIRRLSEIICEPLEIEDYVVQPILEVSPPKWHLGHTTWFFEQFILTKFMKGYQEFHPDFAVLFNSYYNNIGAKIERQERGFMTRPTVKEVLSYRKHVTKNIVLLLSSEASETVLSLVTIGINHEQQHQELLAYDIKYILGTQSIFPAIGNYFEPKEIVNQQEWINVKGGLYKIGHQESSFCFDNELPAHQQYIGDFAISNRLVSNEE